tara:strand:+ start:6645 stop:6863 length:219 start_codon:yes stop_codon:yes gene_type:complete
MAVTYEKGKVTFSSAEEEITINLLNNYVKPVIKVTPSNDSTLYLTDVQSNFFKVGKSSSNSLDIYYVVIEGS